MKINKLIFYWMTIVCVFTPLEVFTRKIRQLLKLVIFAGLLTEFLTGSASSMAAKTIFSPNADGIKDTAVFKLKIDTPEKNISGWLFEITDFKGELIKTFKGAGEPPSKLEWDGKTENQSLVADGLYSYIFSIITKAGNKVQLAPQDIMVDRSDPGASVSVDLDIFSPNSDGVKDETTFSVYGFDANGINSWLLTITDKDNAAVKTFSATGVADIQVSQVWNGKGDFGEDIPDGTYNYHLIVQDNAGNRFKTEPQKIILTRETMVSIIGTDLRLFSPNEDGVKDILNIKISAADVSSIESWKLNILNPLGKVCKTFSGKGSPPNKLIWDGKNDKKKNVDDGTYNLVLSEIDTAGNTVSTVPLPVALDNSPPICRTGLDNKLFSPNGDKVLETAVFSLKITDTHSLEWQLSILDDVDKSVKTFTGRGENPEKSLIWAGKDNNEKDVIEGNFSYFLQAKDIAGNTYQTPKASIQIDRSPPVIAAKASPTLFSPNKDGVMDETKFILQVKDASPLENWKLEIKNSSGKAVKIFKGTTIVGEEIQWDGNGDERKVLPDGTYAWTMEALDIAGNSIRTSPQEIVIGATKPTVSAKSSLDIFSPNADDFKDSVKFSLTVSAFNKIKNWNLKISGMDGEIKRTIGGLGNPSENISWSGERDDKKLLPDSKYNYTFEVIDEAGNHVSSPPEPIVIDTTKPKIQISVNPNIFSPNDDKFKDEVIFALSYQDENPAAQWQLEIENDKKEIVKKFSGQENASIPIAWNGRGEAGNILNDGIYNYLLSAEDVVGNKTTTIRQTLKIDNTSPSVQLSANPTLFSPNNDGARDTTTFLLEYKDSSDISEWTLAATGPEPASRTFKGSGRPSQKIIWDGMNDRGKTLPDGTYSVVLSIIDEVGNTGTSSPIQLKLDTSKPVVSVVTEDEPMQTLIPVRPFTETERGVVISLAAEVLFEIGKADLKPGAKETLDKAASVMRRYPDRKISIEGHTDNVPIDTPQFPNNQVLAEERAKFVLKYFVENLNFSADRFTTKGLGEKQPISPNSNEEGRKKNRRVEIILLK